MIASNQTMALYVFLASAYLLVGLRVEVSASP
jgi:hypothetical protein